MEEDFFTKNFTKKLNKVCRKFEKLINEIWKRYRV